MSTKPWKAQVILDVSLIRGTRLELAVEERTHRLVIIHDFTILASLTAEQTRVIMDYVNGRLRPPDEVAMDSDSTRLLLAQLYNV